MNDIFLSYAGEDRERARQVAGALECLGWSVWWDREIPPGKSFDQVIEEELNGARCVIVLWSQASVRSRWVKTEAAAAADKERLIPVLIDDVPIPFEFKRIQAARLVDWSGAPAGEEFDRLVRAVKDVLGQPEQAKAGRENLLNRAPRRWRAPGAVIAAGLVIVAAGLMLARSVWQRSDRGPNARSSGPPGPSAPSAIAPTEASPVAKPSAASTGAFRIRIGDKIGDGVPAEGAGNIELPGTEDVYLFTAKPRQRVYFRMLEHGPGMHLVSWRLTDELGMELFDSCLGCGDPGAHTLTRGGSYTMTVGGKNNPATGVYRLQLFDVPPPDKFSVRIGDRITAGGPGAGAGLIESPGAEDVYVFTAKSGQKVYFRIVEHSPQMALVRWRLVDDNDMEVFDSCLGCGDPGVHTLFKGGTYSLIVGSRNVPATGGYTLELGGR
ncbi:MAG TPA: TIR domain-containing protein [Candidatus Acidoferrales bacterium]|nr:TIR domain-containing protein [Candidatus Acidoferrales bacterium]